MSDAIALWECSVFAGIQPVLVSATGTSSVHDSGTKATADALLLTSGRLHSSFMDHRWLKRMEVYFDARTGHDHAAHPINKSRIKRSSLDKDHSYLYNTQQIISVLPAWRLAAC
jgi:hypothetical protein